MRTSTVSVDLTIKGLSPANVQRITEFLAALTPMSHNLNELQANDAADDSWSAPSEIPAAGAKVVVGTPAAQEFMGALTEQQPAPVSAFVPTNDASGELDADGLRWDSRIHASSREKKQDGRWKARRGVTAELVNTVTAELRSAGVPAQAAQVQSAPAQPAPVQPAQQYAAPQEPVQQYAPAAVPQAPQAAGQFHPNPVVQQVVPVNDFTGVMNRVKAGLDAQKIGPDYLQYLMSTINAHFGVQITAISAIQSQQPMIDYAHGLLTQQGL